MDRASAGGRNQGMSALDEALSDLKRRGSVSLVVGSVPPESYAEVSRRMLGRPDDDRPRRRLLVVPESDRRSAVERLRATGPLDRAHAAIITCNGTARSAASAESGPGESGNRPPVRRVDGGLAELGGAITDVVDRFDAASGGLEPAELRVGIDPLPERLAAGGTPAAFGFLHAFTEQVRRTGGMGHVGVPRDRDDRTVRTLAPLFDALLELRLAGQRLEQRWHLRDRDLVSDWLAVTEVSGGEEG
ncbi:MAG: hypothetical protein ABEH78_10530 [Haloferacaceae archaeon]